jgi:chemotaxis protein MotA
MLLVIGFLVVVGAALGGFMVAGGHPAVLMHVSEFIIIGGVAGGALVVASPPSVLKATMKYVIAAFKRNGVTPKEYEDLLKMLYEMFLVGRRNGLIALDEHISDPANSHILEKYPTFSNNPDRVEFLSNGLRPLIDGKVKPEQIQGLLDAEVNNRDEEVHGPLSVINLVGDSLPGIGIVAAVLGIINTMSAIADGPEAVGYKVAAALTGTFLGVYGAYGFVNPLHRRISFLAESETTYYRMIAKAVGGFANGMAPIMAIEMARRTMERSQQPDAEELEANLKNLVKQG